MGKYTGITFLVAAVTLLSGCAVPIHDSNASTLNVQHSTHTTAKCTTVKPYVGHHIGATAGYAINKYPAKINVYTQKYGGPLPVPPSVYRQSNGVVASHTKRG